MLGRQPGAPPVVGDRLRDAPRGPRGRSPPPAPPAPRRQPGGAEPPPPCEYPARLRPRWSRAANCAWWSFPSLVVRNGTASITNGSIFTLGRDGVKSQLCTDVTPGGHRTVALSSRYARRPASALDGNGERRGAAG